MGNWPTIICMFLALSTHCYWMSSPSRKWERRVRPRIHLVVFMYAVNQENQAGESKIPNTNGGKLLHRPSTSYKKLFGRVAFGIIFIIPWQFYLLILDVFWNNFHELIIQIGHMTGMSCLLTRLHKAVVCQISISYHTEAMGNGVTQLTFTCSKSTIETLEKGVKYVQS